MGPSGKTSGSPARRPPPCSFPSSRATPSTTSIENLALDGNRPHNDNLDGNYSGCIFLQDCNRITVRRVEARANNGDGISWQVCHDVTVEECHSHGHAGLGLHPGSGSQRPTIRNNRIEHNDIGLFFCWGVREGIAEKNTITDSLSHGISIGHRDTDNLVRDNRVIRSGKVGILFRDEARAFAGHRNRIERNEVVDSGPDDGVAIDVRGETEGVVLSRNDLRETRSPAHRVAVRIGPRTREVSLVDNRYHGFHEDVQRPSTPA
ncbi:MAG: right-handed parallel beta-helix repeat-containing protein [Isosphaeraceae bacterium]